MLKYKYSNQLSDKLVLTQHKPYQAQVKQNMFWKYVNEKIRKHSASKSYNRLTKKKRMG